MMLSRTSAALARTIVGGSSRAILALQAPKLVARLPQTRVVGVSAGMRWFSTTNSDNNGQSDAEEGKTTDKRANGETAGEEFGETDKIIDKLEAELKKMEQEVTEMKSRALRAYADAENTRTIAKRDVENAKSYAIQSFAKSLLDVADNLSRAIEAVPPEARDKTDDNAQLILLLQGVEMTSNQLSKVFREFGIIKVSLWSRFGG